jgi:hypothetical protein
VIRDHQRLAAAAGSTRLGTELAELNTCAPQRRTGVSCRLRPGSGIQPVAPADVRSILAAGVGAPPPRTAGNTLALGLPAVPVRPLADYALDSLT